MDWIDYKTIFRGYFCDQILTHNLTYYNRTLHISLMNSLTNNSSTVTLYIHTQV